jgi:cell division protein ZapB
VKKHLLQRLAAHLQSSAMSAPSPLDQIAERVERLLVRHEEIQRTNALLQEQVEALTRERDALKSRLAAARTRIDAVLERLPVEPPQDPASP